VSSIIRENDRLEEGNIIVQSLAMPSGFCLLEKRFVDVAIRYGTHPATVDRWKAVLGIKAYFEGVIGGSIYDWLPGAVENSFRQ
jgi:hypothetical protein